MPHPAPAANNSEQPRTQAERTALAESSMTLAAIDLFSSVGIQCRTLMAHILCASVAKVSQVTRCYRRKHHRQVQRYDAPLRPSEQVSNGEVGYDATKPHSPS